MHKCGFLFVVDRLGVIWRSGPNLIVAVHKKKKKKKKPNNVPCCTLR
jgi:hypothetical protein